MSNYGYTSYDFPRDPEFVDEYHDFIESEDLTEDEFTIEEYWQHLCEQNEERLIMSYWSSMDD